jgi:hypothetical protein
MTSKEDLLTNKIFLNAALPLMKTIAEDDPKIHKMFSIVHCIYQVSCLDPDAPGGKYATHFQVNCDEWKVHPRVEPHPMIEIEFPSVQALNSFFKGKIGLDTLPKMKGVVRYPQYFVPFITCLLKMANLLGMTEAPEDVDTKRLLVKCYFYLLTSGISQLNKNGDEEVHGWALKSPDRVYAFDVEGEPSVAAFIRVKAGKTKAGRGVYKRAMPFFTMQFDSLDSALGILMGTADMLQFTREKKLNMLGAPEYGATLGNFMMKVGAMAK